MPAPKSRLRRRTSLPATSRKDSPRRWRSSFWPRTRLRREFRPECVESQQEEMYSRRHLQSLPWIVAMLATQAAMSATQQPATAPAASQGNDTRQSNDLQKQLDQLKQQYEATTHDLQARIAALEQQIEKQKEDSEKTSQGTVSTTELAVEKAAQGAVLGESTQV